MTTEELEQQSMAAWQAYRDDKTTQIEQAVKGLERLNWTPANTTNIWAIGLYHYRLAETQLNHVDLDKLAIARAVTYIRMYELPEMRTDAGKNAIKRIAVKLEQLAAYIDAQGEALK